MVLLYHGPLSNGAIRRHPQMCMSKIISQNVSCLLRVFCQIDRKLTNMCYIIWASVYSLPPRYESALVYHILMDIQKYFPEMYHFIKS